MVEAAKPARVATAAERRWGDDGLLVGMEGFRISAGGSIADSVGKPLGSVLGRH